MRKYRDDVATDVADRLFDFSIGMFADASLAAQNDRKLV